ncbi:MAG: ATP-grasp domain-containing protein [Alphaproteobacteria bacterium]|nr:ATP-grasp domain-containing protein [Alphaproteobacteria bacterium]
MKNVLVFPCGTEIGLEIHRSLKFSRHFKLFGASSVDDHGKYVYENYTVGLPFVDADDFIEKINVIVETCNIDFIIPAHDSVVLKLIENQSLIKADVVTSCIETCRTCRSKKETYKLFSEIIPTPEVYDPFDTMRFPVFLKPDIGQGSKGTFRAETKGDVDYYLEKDPSLLVLEYLPGKEYTVDCFTDKKGELLFAEGRERARIYNGISVNSKPAQNARFHEVAEIINKTLSFQGVWFYQVKERANGELVLMEIAPRVAGTMALFRAYGVNFIQLNLFDRMGLGISILRNNMDAEIDRALCSKFKIKNDYDSVYIDFDDTIIINNRVNTNVISFLYQSRNAGKNIVLLSRHKLDIKESLQKFAISPLLFDEIIILDENKKKSDFIASGKSIFIDDSFAERKEVSEKRNIPVFALDAVEALLIG